MSHRMLGQDLLTSIRAIPPKIKRLNRKISRVMTDEIQRKTAEETFG